MKKNKHLLLEILIPVLVIFSVVVIFFTGKNFVFNRSIKLGFISDSKTLSERGADFAISDINNRGGLVINNRRYRVDLMQVDNKGIVDGNDLEIPFLIKEEVKGISATGNKFSEKSIEEMKAKNILYNGFFIENKIEEGKIASLFAFNNLGAKKAAVLYNSDDPLFIKQAESFKKSFENLGGEVSFFEGITDKTSELVTIILRLKASGAEIVFAPLKAKDIPYYIQLAHYFSYRAPFIGTEGWTDSKLTSTCEMECNGSYFISYFYANSERRKFIESYKNVYKTEPNEDIIAGYEMINRMLLKIQNMDEGQNNIPYNILKIEDKEVRVVE